MVSHAWLFVLLFKTKSNTVTLCSLKMKQKDSVGKLLGADVGLVFVFVFPFLSTSHMRAALPPRSGPRSQRALPLTGRDC